MDQIHTTLAENKFYSTFMSSFYVGEGHHRNNPFWSHMTVLYWLAI